MIQYKALREQKYQIVLTLFWFLFWRQMVHAWLNLSSNDRHVDDGVIMNVHGNVD